MEAVATAAGVGKGTLFRRFGDRVGLLQALLQHSDGKRLARTGLPPHPAGHGSPRRGLRTGTAIGARPPVRRRTCARASRTGRPGPAASRACRPPPPGRGP
uniref:TetR/AcrR family transcriptional regulator n=1 Tax=Streptomyces griseoaurantiacus TaxID=68213 RepID=UPI003F58232F